MLFNNVMIHLDSLPPIPPVHSTKQDQSRRKNIRNAGIFIGIILLIAAVSLATYKHASTTMPAQSGSVLNDFALADLSGKTVRLSDFRGRLVLVNAWATWCPPCTAEMPVLEAFYRANRETGFIILAVNAGDSRDVAAAFAANLGLSFPVLLDSDVAVLDGLGIHSYPTSVLVGSDGIVLKIHVGMLSPELLESEILPFIQP